MIDSQYIDNLPEEGEYRNQVKLAFALIGESGVIQAQIQSNKEALLAGSDSESEKELALGIIEYRKKTQALQQLQLLCEHYHREIRS